MSDPLRAEGGRGSHLLRPDLRVIDVSAEESLHLVEDPAPSHLEPEISQEPSVTPMSRADAEALRAEALSWLRDLSQRPYRPGPRI